MVKYIDEEETVKDRIEELMGTLWLLLLVERQPLEWVIREDCDEVAFVGFDGKFPSGLEDSRKQRGI